MRPDECALTPRSPLQKFAGVVAWPASLLAVAAATLFMSIAANAQGILAGNDRLRVSHLVSVDRAPAGESFEAVVLLDLDEGWHVQAAEPTYDYLIATRLTVDAPEGMTVGQVAYPAAKTIDFAGDQIAVYGGRVPLRFPVHVAPDADPGPRSLTARLTAQLCDDQVCLAPTTRTVDIPIEVVPAGTGVTARHSEWFDTTEHDGAAAVVQSPENEIERLFGERRLLPALLAIFLIGLALNLTPCVYPMLSVTVSIFGGQNDTRTLGMFGKAVVYVLGIATMYSVLGTLAALTGGLFGGLMQSRWVLATIALLLAALALSMFGLYEIRPPNALVSRFGNRAGSSAGWLGVYLSGLVVGVFAAPCIGPPIIALLALVGARGDVWFGFGSFFVLALGLGAPYLLLGTFSGMLQRLPRSGAWMVWVRKVFGVALLGVAAFYAALGFAPSLLAWSPILTLLLGGAYLGFIERSGNDRTVFRRVKWALGAVSVAAGLTLLVTEQQRDPMEWERYSPQSLNAALDAGQPVVLDFYADWCIPCHELERRTFSDPKVRDALRNHARFKVDLTRMDSTESLEAMQRFEVQGVPTVIFLDEDGRERPNTRVLGFMPPDDFLNRAGL